MSRYLYIFIQRETKKKTKKNRQKRPKTKKIMQYQESHSHIREMVFGIKEKVERMRREDDEVFCLDGFGVSFLFCFRIGTTLLWLWREYTRTLLYSLSLSQCCWVGIHDFFVNFKSLNLRIYLKLPQQNTNMTLLRQHSVFFIYTYVYSLVLAILADKRKKDKENKKTNTKLGFNFSINLSSFFLSHPPSPYTMISIRVRTTIIMTVCKWTIVLVVELEKGKEGGRGRGRGL